jgi:hypothetical protein
MDLHEIRSDPKRASEYASLAADLASAVGESFGEGVQEGLTSNEDSDAQNSQDDGEELETSLDGLDVPEPSVNGESKATSNEVDSGPSTLDDLSTEQTESENNDTESNSETMNKNEVSEQDDADDSADAQRSETTGENPSPEDLAEAI